MTTLKVKKPVCGSGPNPENAGPTDSESAKIVVGCSDSQLLLASKRFEPAGNAHFRPAEARQWLERYRDFSLGAWA